MGSWGGCEQKARGRGPGQKQDQNMWPSKPQFGFKDYFCCCSVTQSCLTLRPHGLQHSRLPCPSQTPRACSHLEPDILECEVKWALGGITMNKASGGDGIPVELFQILKDNAVKVLQSLCRKFGKLSSGHRTGKCQFSFHSQRKAMPKNAQTTTQLHSSHMLVK